MVTKFQVLASGSNGNCSIITTSNGAILIDCGISRKKLITLLKTLKVSITSIKGLLLSHSHTDHCFGLPVISEMIHAPIICSAGTLEELRKHERLDFRWSSIRRFSKTINPHEELFIADFSIQSLVTFHDASGASGFFIKTNDANFTIITDTGKIFPEHIDFMKRSNILLIEMNHELANLYSSNRPIWLKKRIDEYHLSNDQVIRIFRHLEETQIVGLFFGHLSGECNSPSIVENRLVEWAQKRENFPWKCYICTRTAPSSMITLKNREIIESTQPALSLKKLQIEYTPRRDLLFYFQSETKG